MVDWEAEAAKSCFARTSLGGGFGRKMRRREREREWESFFRFVNLGGV